MVDDIRFSFGAEVGNSCEIPELRTKKEDESKKDYGKTTAAVAKVSSMV